MSDEPPYLGPDKIIGMPTPGQWTRKAYDDIFTVPPPVVNFPSAPPPPPIFNFRGPLPSDGNYTPIPGGAAQGPVLSPAWGLALLGVGAVLWMNTSVLLAGALIVGVLVGGLIGGTILWPATRIWSSGIKAGLIFQTGLLSVFAYVATVYLLSHYDAWVLAPIDQRLQHWFGTFPEFTWPTGNRSSVSAIIMTQVLGLLVAATTISARLKDAFGGVAGFLRACVVSVLILVTVCGGTALLVRQVAVELNSHSSTGTSARFH
jgi:hypothetical protein